MATVVQGGSTTRRRTVLYAVCAALVVLAIVAGFAFVNSVNVSRVTSNARSLHWNNSAIGVSALTRAGLVQAVTFTELEASGDVTSDDAAFAMEQIEKSTDELQQLVASGSQHDSHAELARFAGEVESVVEALVQGEVASARSRLLTSLEPVYVELSRVLLEEQAEIQMAIQDNTATGQAVNGWVVFVLTLAVPGAAVVTYFIIARRQIRAVEERTRIALEAEREIGRAKDAFIAGLSHELRTPLTSIYGFAEILSDDGVQGAEATRETAQIIASESAEMTRMVDDLLAASRLDSTGLEIEMTATRVQDVIEAAVAPFERAGVEVARQPSAAMVKTDPARLRHVLVNLISNAVRHGGPDVAVSVTAGEQSVDVEVVDNGPGVPEERVANLYDRFAHDGSEPLLTGSVGLGLAVASRMTHLLGGAIRHQRYNGKTYFVVTVPADAAPGSEDAEGASVADMIRALSS
ncbi:MAG TPA: HAMP domain-containing sensor histidine kinase [Acidimicrobiia bacterium]